MNEVEWQAAWKLYQSASSMSEEEIQRLLESSTDSPEVRDAVRRMRQADDVPETQTSWNSASDGGTASAWAASSTAGTAIGRYLLVEKIGEGGMGEVWLAEQQEPVHRRVALKLIKAGMNSREVIRRFESERQALALMDHPGIARVFDAGSTIQGAPYFVMEYASGEPITTYCDRHRLTTRARLELFGQVCEAVQHAHQKAIIHRDLKPSNILVTEVDGRPTPKIIDFGIAKALSQNLTDETHLTKMGALMGTPEYMSPEQALSSGEDIDTRTDVYSLGVVLYELLAGERPIEMHRIPLAEFLERLRDDDPPRPSTRITGQAATTSTEVARKRQTEPAHLARQLNGDLDAIALKALEKDRSRRYSTPMELAADIRRYLNHEPVTARAPSASYRAGKYIRRHRYVVSAAAFALLLLVAFVVAQTVQLRRTTRERDRANRVTDFVTRMFKVSNPSEARGNTITAREILDKSSNEIETGLAKDPEDQAQMMHVMANVYFGLGLLPKAESLARRAVDLRKRVLGASRPETLDSMALLAEVLNEENKEKEAEQLCRETLEARRRVQGPDRRETLESMRMLGSILNQEGRYAEAEAIHRELAERSTRVFGRDDQMTVSTMHQLAVDLAYEGKSPEAEKVFREILAFESGRNPFDSPLVLAARIDLGACLQQEEHFAEAEKIYNELIPDARRVLGPDHPRTLLAMGNLALAYAYENKLSAAEKLFREALDVKRKVLGPEHRSTTVTMGNLADVLRMEGNYSESERLFRETIAIQRRTLGPTHSDVLNGLHGLGELLRNEKRYADAEKVLQECLQAQRKTLGDDHPDTASTAYDLAMDQASEGKRDDAFTNLKFALDHQLSGTMRATLAEEPAFLPFRSDARFAPLLAAAQPAAAK
ncbi:MAG TPA: serine/threonine-protein kinase [Bryobacteraceae bacterium]|nr:serine/threonine-protein kinase [Bryobacteraceae bacterium]